jgi:hypothetical protein
VTAPTINGAKYPQPVDALLPAARKLAAELGEVPSRNRLMTEFRIGAPKAVELRDRLAAEQAKADDVEAMRTYLAARGGLPSPVRDDWTLAPSMAPAPYGPDPAPAVDEQPVTGPAGRAAVPGFDPATVAVSAAAGPVVAAEAEPQPAVVGHPGTKITDEQARKVPTWPVWLIALPAFVAVWSGWVGLGKLTGFGKVDLLPGIVDPGSWATIDSAITLPIGVEVYGAYALRVWLSGAVPDRARRYARWSAVGSLLVGALGQVAYHVLVATGVTAAPWWITTAVACLPVVVLGMGAGLAHLIRHGGAR